MDFKPDRIHFVKIIHMVPNRKTVCSAVMKQQVETVTTNRQLCVEIVTLRLEQYLLGKPFIFLFFRFFFFRKIVL